ncbi:uncharacterized protein LOC106641508 [Copidosoma floridanum]|uniref:uncharacterized protein LOC106641508 n=1 Tax=Copidosoma floridanum TaxID=29053 RepID=UPI0006C987EA|nr:uncharacterized protein LOC106641508 [Copidosoma floridanum]
MRTFVLLVVLAICVTEVFPSTLNEQQKEKLLQIRNVCLYESGVNQFDIFLAKKAIGPVKKLVRASHCVAQGLIEQQDDPIIKELILLVQQTIQNSSLSQMIAQAAQLCGKLLGGEVCGKLHELVELVIKNVRSV